MSYTDDASATPQELNFGRPSTLDRTTQARVLRSWFREGAQHSATWRKEAREDFDFKAGRQWSELEKRQLQDQLRPEIVFNRALTTIKAVAGFEINNRHEIHFLPRTIDDTAVNEVLNGASKWMGDESEAEDEESQAFQDCTICGMGWTGARLSYDEDVNGLYDEPRINPLEMFWDGRARKRNLGDTRWRAWLRKVSLAEAKDMFNTPERKYDDSELDAKWASDIETQDNPRNSHPPRTESLFDRDHADDDITDVHVAQMQWWEKVPLWVVADPQTNQKIELDDAKYQILASRMQMIGMKLTAARGTKKCFYQAFIGGVILDSGPAPQPDKFTFECITGEPDENKGTWFGLMRVMRDPAKWSNKFLSQIMHIINSNAKGGIMAEPDAFDDQRQAEQSYACPEEITWMAKGAMGGASKTQKWAPKPQAQFPAGIFQLLEFAVSSIRDVTGINLELLGLKDVNQPGVLEAQRKQAGMTVLATMFDSLRRFRKRIGKIRLYYIQNFLSDGRLIRIVGQEGAKVIPLMRDKTLGQYDVVVDDAPTSPNQKEQNWALIAPLLPVFKEQLMANPKVLIEILRFSPLPSRVIEAIEAVINQPNPDQQMKDQIAQKLMQLQIPAEIAKINKDQSTAEMNNAKAQTSAATAQYDLAMAQNLLVKHQGDMLKATMEWMKTQREAQQSGLDAMHKVAQIDESRAKAEKTRAETGKTVADTHSSHADAIRTRIGSLIDALTPIEEPQPAGQAA